MDNSNLTKEILDNVIEISEQRNYWFVRTQGGEFYEDFSFGNFISIGYDKILLSDITEAKNSPSPTEFLAEKVRKFYEDNGTPTHTANQILKFVYEIKKGDIVLIPSVSSSEIRFGEVVETPLYLKSDSNDFDNCTFQKRKKIKWLKKVYKNKLNPNLYKLIYLHHAVTDASAYDQYIDKTLNTFFIKHGKAHLVIDIQTQKGIHARQLFRTGLNLLDTLDEYEEFENVDLDTNDIETKVNLESPGTIEFISENIQSIFIIGFLIVSLIGGNFAISKFSFKSKGLVQSIIDFWNQSKDIKIKEQLVQQLKSLQIQSPDDIVKILNALNQNKQNNDSSNDIKIIEEDDKNENKNEHK